MHVADNDYFIFEDGRETRIAKRVGYDLIF
jgi:hypothetical protein